MTLHDRLHQLASALPSDDAGIFLNRADLLALLEEDGSDWKIPRSALRDYLTAQTETNDPPSKAGEVEIGDWRKIQRT